MQTNFFQRYPYLKDILSIFVFIACVLIGTLFINTFVFRSFSVVGPSMETTLYTNDRLIVNRVAVTISQLQNKIYLPKRGQVIVFKNPQYSDGLGDEYIVKRVIALSGERVVLKNGAYTIYNKAHPEGFNPDQLTSDIEGNPTSGSGDWTVPNGELFVSGDHRQNNYSYDSRNGLGMIPAYDVVGPVVARIYPFNKIRTFN